MTPATAAAAAATKAASTNLDVTHAYRRLYRSLLQAVRYSAPARYVARDQLRAAFREKEKKPGQHGASAAAVLDGEGVKRTVWFLEAAARERGLEHRILKNLVRVRLESGWGVRSWRRAVNESKQKADMKQLQQEGMKHYNMTVAMLNKSMGLCLR
ncbi:DUF1763-domain-containing protein [Trichoderma citrinoviride]|uniref:DUF1763-domain-containing protein n=1 Tax=Trichoderma citrinoviride TaxID=58853 RepID=A0A2T4BAZ4_9HYPO|nr:DUF1763-domain-containing protein [Trichoderma citrinoviride]PTB66458.1 DUF1763-domain-containing protein [Trichoderma citrinoviride]